ncbi:MAG: hypothetical protein JWN43_2780 [Gammaproteobacteria bacterium]|nr:hypothetical protein [Gammaproteobacteria bacterium]
MRLKNRLMAWWGCGLCLAAGGLDAAATAGGTAHAQFQTSDRCVACHNGMTNSAGDDYSIGIDWGTSLMANSARDPYWQASVRRETIDHGESRTAIEDDCSSCHMPVMHYMAKQSGKQGQVFAHLPLHSDASREAADGVTCSVCHQITPQDLGKAASFNGNFVVDGPGADGAHAEFGPYEVTPGLQRVMRSSTGGFEPQHGEQMRTAELCASCHTLITEARGANGAVVGSLPEQMPYQEWLHSDFRNERTCQSCHMPAVQNDTPITRILGAQRPGAARHQFVGANFVMQRILSRYHDELDVSADSRELYNAADRTVRYLQSEAASLSVATPEIRNRRLEANVTVGNLGGHKLPTAYPARRAWLHVVVRDRDHRAVFESGALNPDGSIAGNDNDQDATKYEPHYREIRDAGQVQIYETILGDSDGRVTTGLLTAVGYLKDNRLLPRGFSKSDAAPEIAVHGDALADPAFTDRGHAVRYSIDVGSAVGPFEVDAELWYQPIGFRWANNLKAYKAAEEPHRFTEYFDSMGAGSAVLLVKASGSTR